MPALQNQLSNGNAKSDNLQHKRARAPIEQLRPFTLALNWNHSPTSQHQKQQHQQYRVANAPKFASLRRRDDEGNNDLKVASSQDSRRSENEEQTTKPAVALPSLEYALPFLFPRYNENYTGEAASITTSTAPPPPVTSTTTTQPTTAGIFIHVPDTPKFVQQNEVDSPQHQASVNHFSKDSVSSNLIQGRILNHGGHSPNAIPDDRQRPSARIPDNTPTPFETNELLPVMPSNEIPQPAAGLLPPFDTFTSYDESATQGPPIFFEWKIPASGLEPPKFEVNDKPTAIDDNQIPVLPPAESAQPSVNIPIIEKDLVPPIYDINRLTLTKIRIPAIEQEPPRLVSPIVVNDTGIYTNNHTFPSLTPLHAAINNATVADKSQTPRSVANVSQTASTNVIPSTTGSSTRATTKATNYLDLQKEFLIPSYTFPLETIDERPSYETNNVYNSFQVKLPDGSNSNNIATTNPVWYGENAACPECHPSFLKPGTCEPCVKFR